MTGIMLDRPALLKKFTHPNFPQASTSDQPLNKPGVKLHWVEAPPGFGKSTLLANVRNVALCESLSYSFRSHDTINCQLYNFFSKAIQTLTGSHGLLDLLQKRFSFAATHFSDEFAKEFFRLLNQPIILLLDDYQYVEKDEQTNQLLISFINSASENCTIVIASRGKPHQYLERLRFNQVLSLTNTEDLTFSQNEINQLLTSYNLDTQEIARQIMAHTQGWPAAVTLYIQGMLSHGASLNQVKKSFALSIYNYYLAEIRPLIPIELFKPLAKLPCFTPEMAAAVCGTSIDEMQDLLLHLQRNQFFVYQHEKSNHHYALHAVIQYALQEYQTLKLTAEERHSYNIGCSWEEFADLIAEQAEDFNKLSLDSSLQELIDIIPTEIYNNHTWLRYWRARLLITRQPRKARILFSELFFEREAEDDTETQLILWSSIIETYVIELSEFRSVFPWVEKLTELEKKISGYPSIECEAEVLSGLHSLFQWIPPLDYDIDRLFTRTERILYELNDPKQKIRLACAYIRHLVNQGSYYRSLALIGVIRENFNYQTLSPSDAVLLHYSRLIGNYIAGLRTTDEHLALKQAQIDAKSQGMTIIDISVRYTLILAYLEHNNLEMAKNKITEAKMHLDKGFALEKAHLEFVAGWLALIENDYERARQHQLLCHQYTEETGELCTMYTLAHLAIIETDCGNYGKAISHLTDLRCLAYDKRAGIAKLHYHYSKAYYLLSTNAFDEGLEQVRTLFTICRENAIFTFAGRVRNVMVLLFEIAIENEIEPLFIKKMIAFQNIRPLMFGNLNSAWPHAIKISVLGSVDIEVGRDKLIGSKKPSKIELRLLKLLISNEGKPMDINTIEEIIWPEQNTLELGSNFKSTASRVRKRLGEKDIIIVKDNRAYLNKDIVWVDTWGLTECLDRLNNKLTNLSNIEYRRYCDAFAKLYRGDFYLDYESELWLSTYQYDIQSKYIRFMRAAVEWHTSLCQTQPSLDHEETLNKLSLQLNYVYARTIKNLIRYGNVREATKRKNEMEQLFSKFQIPILEVALATS